MLHLPEGVVRQWFREDGDMPLEVAEKLEARAVVAAQNPFPTRDELLDRYGEDVGEE